MAAHQASRPWDSPGKNTGVGCHFPLQCMKVKSESEVTRSYPTLSDPWTAAYQAPPSMGFSRQGYWSGLPLPSPRTGDRYILNPFLQGDLDGNYVKDGKFSESWEIKMERVSTADEVSFPLVLLLRLVVQKSHHF